MFFAIVYLDPVFWDFGDKNQEKTIWIRNVEPMGVRRILGFGGKT
jgi:hypothetical protein